MTKILYCHNIKKYRFHIENMFNKIVLSTQATMGDKSSLS